MPVWLSHVRMETHRRKIEGSSSHEERCTRVYPLFFSGATECELDKQGRINIASPLLSYAKLEKECVVIGVSNRIELWSREIWEQYVEEQEDSFAEIAENMIGFDI